MLFRSIEDIKNLGFAGMDLRRGEEYSIDLSFDEFYDELTQIMQMCESQKIERMTDEEYIMKVDDLLHTTKVNDYTRSEAIRKWFYKIMEVANYDIDVWKKHKAMIYTIHILDYIEDSEFNEFANKLLEKLDDMENEKGKKMIRISRGDLLAQKLVGDVLGIRTPFKDVIKFQMENKDIVERSFKQLSNIAMELYNKQTQVSSHQFEVNKVLQK